ARVEPATVRGRRRVAPDKILIIKFDGGEVVRFIVGDPRQRIGSEDGAGVDGDDVARSVERDVLRQGLNQFGAASDGIAGQLQGDMNRSAGLDARVKVL